MAPIDQTVIDAFLIDGIVPIRSLVSAPWLEVLRQGVERNMAEPGPWADDHPPKDGKGRFFEDYCNWQRIPEFEDFVRHSGIAAAGARLMGASRVQLFHDHVLVKEPGTINPTPWHHDMPYYCVEGNQTLSLWIPLDSVPLEVSPRFVPASHLWGALFQPRAFDDGKVYDEKDQGYRPVPDIDAQPGAYRIAAWDLAPGDALAFNYRTLHSAPGNPGPGRRRGFSLRLIGDDVTFVKRAGKISPPYPDMGMRSGEKMREDLFPLLWSAQA